MGIFLPLAQHANEIGEIAEAEPNPRHPKLQRQKRTKLIQEIYLFGTCSETQQRKQLTIKKLLYLINEI